MAKSKKGKTNKKPIRKPLIPDPTEKSKTTEIKKSSVISLKNIPHGFYEKQIFLYFKQFGQVEAVKCFQYTKKGHYGRALVKFQNRKVAKIAAESIDGTFILGKKIRSEIAKKWSTISKLKKDPFLRANLNDDDHEVLDDPIVKFRKKVIRLNRKKSPEEHKKEVDSFKKGNKKNLAKLEKLGINCDFVTRC